MTSAPDYDDLSVHATHCCAKHWCKYGDDDCPVMTGQVEGIKTEACEFCDYEREVAQTVPTDILVAEVHRRGGEIHDALCQRPPVSQGPIPAPDYTMRVNFAHSPLPDRNTKRGEAVTEPKQWTRRMYLTVRAMEAAPWSMPPVTKLTLAMEAVASTAIEHLEWDMEERRTWEEWESDDKPVPGP